VRTSARLIIEYRALLSVGRKTNQTAGRADAVCSESLAMPVLTLQNSTARSLRLAAWASHIQCFCFWNDFLANLIYIK